MRTVAAKNECVGVFCGARPGARARYVELAKDFGTSLARRGLALVYGAGGIGVMGAVADAVLAAGGSVTGVVPGSLQERERSDRARGTVFVVKSMHERKALMYRLSSCFAVLPGGIGTLDELMEVATWNRLGIIEKPIVVVNYEGFFDPMLGMLDHVVREGFLSAEERRLIQVASDTEEAFDRLGAAGTTAPVGTPGGAAPIGRLRRGSPRRGAGAARRRAAAP